MINMFPNQDMKPLLPALNAQRSPVYYRHQTPVSYAGVYPPNYQVAYLPPIGYEAQTVLPPLQFYSSSGTSPSPHPEQKDGNYKLNYNYGGSYQVSPRASTIEMQQTTPQFTSVPSPSASSDGGHKDLPINYSSIINYTISPSLKRKRRNKTITDASSIQSQLPCPTCGKVFQKPYNLKSHMKSHSDEKPFKCSVCPKTFARSHDKKRHELLHNGEKNFKCEGYLKDGKTKWGCGKQFARSDALSRHFRTETGWLCIKPLMDEAKTLEASGVINDIISKHE